MKSLHDMTETERAAEWKRIGMFKYAVQWRQELRELSEADRQRITSDVNHASWERIVARGER